MCKYIQMETLGEKVIFCYVFKNKFSGFVIRVVLKSNSVHLSDGGRRRLCVIIAVLCSNYCGRLGEGVFFFKYREVKTALETRHLLQLIMCTS